MVYSRIANANSNGKMAARGKKLRFDSTRIYRLWDPATGQVSIDGSVSLPLM
jgi:hypothetical protein